MSLEFAVPGQGVVLFAAAADACAFVVSDAARADGLLVEWAAAGVTVRRISAPAPYDACAPHAALSDSPPLFAAAIGAGVPCWFSLDAQNLRLAAGVGEARLETCVYRCRLPAADDAERRANKAFLESLTSVGSFVAAAPLRLIRDPVANALPLRVRAGVSLDSLAKQLYLPAAHLPPASRQLFECVAGCELDADDFPEFSRAVAQSIAAGWCARRLAEKAGEFGDDPAATYLRITLGANGGESPGAPYVLEIWPAGHYSPVHSHAGAEAVIKVLHGGIQVQLFPFLAAGVAPFATADFAAGDVTWISPALNQTHQLRNRGDGPCITIQCYMYGFDDDAHYDYFDYLDGAAVKRFEPDSDMEFAACKELMRAEWAGRPAAPRGGLACFGL